MQYSYCHALKSISLTLLAPTVPEEPSDSDTSILSTTTESDATDQSARTESDPAERFARWKQNLLDFYSNFNPSKVRRPLSQTCLFKRPPKKCAGETCKHDRGEVQGTGRKSRLQSPSVRGSKVNSPQTVADKFVLLSCCSGNMAPHPNTQSQFSVANVTAIICLQLTVMIPSLKSLWPG